MNINDVNIEELNKLSAEDLIIWAFDNFKSKCAIGTSFQLTGSVIVDLASKKQKDFRVFTIDTLRLHKETYDTIEKFEKYFNIKVERFKPSPGKVNNMVESFGEYLFFNDKAKQEYCCNIRKVEPNFDALDTLDCWITGLRNDQSEMRKQLPKAEIIEHDKRKILKISPLIDWTVKDIWKHIKDNNVPYNSLFDQGYDSIGCFICSTPIVKGEAPRSGRWRWFNNDDDNKECGIHINTKGDNK